MRFVSGPCSETQPASASSDNGRGKGARALMEARGRYPVRRAAVPRRATVTWWKPARPLPGRAVCAVSLCTSRRPRDYPSSMDTTRITPKPNGPLVVEGPVKIITPDGRELPVPPRKDGRPAEVVVLCRCGGSATKPFCDGTHKRIGFCDAPPAPPAGPAPTAEAGGIMLSPFLP